MNAEPMYKSLPEVFQIIRTVLEERRRWSTGYSRTVESGVIEEHVVFGKGTDRGRILLSARPCFLSDPRRLECTLFQGDAEVRGEITPYLEACARANEAELIVEDRTCPEESSPPEP